MFGLKRKAKLWRRVTRGGRVQHRQRLCHGKRQAGAVMARHADTER